MTSTFFKKSGESTIKCFACKHNCSIPTTSFGLCGVRKNENGKIKLITHSKPASLHLDPIEKKPLYHYLPGSKTMSIGFFGCNFKCDFCQNYDISFCKGSSAEKKLINAESVSPKKFVELAIEEEAKSVAITYNEPAISVEYNLESFKLAKENKLGTVYVSNGYFSEEQLKALTKKNQRLDAINIDLKSFNENFYRSTCGATLEGVLSSIKETHKAGIWMELTTLLIPGKNDSAEELKQIANFIYSIDKNIPWHVSAFFPMHKMTNISPTSTNEIINAINIGKEVGLNYIYAGNVRGTNFESTFCPKCKFLLIKRNGYNTEIVGLHNEKKETFCKNCGEKIQGVF
jgi:pyruvate formate lyase activating enzyme